jgi:Domain of unknown function (DUF4214)
MGQYAQAIQQLYVSYFSRPADKAGLAYWEGVVEKAKGDLSQISAAFSQSNEYRDMYAGKSHAEIIDQVYVNLFGRHAEEGGKAYWTDLLDKKALSIDHIVESLASGARGNDMMALKYKVTTALSFSVALDTPQEIAGFSSSRAISGAKDLLASVVDASSLISVLAPGGKLEKLLSNIATNFGIAVGEPHPGQGVAVGEPHPGQGIAVGEPHPGQGIAVGEPHPGQGIAVGEPTTVDGSKIQGYLVESGCELCGTPNVDITLVGLGVS